MELWLQTEVRMRRDDAFRVAHRKRLARLAEADEVAAFAGVLRTEQTH